MAIFEDRENRAETAFVLDAAKEFKSEAKRNKLLGEWAAALMGIEGDGVDKYALSVIIADMEEAGDDDVFRKLRKDLDCAGVDMTDAALREKMAECLQAARVEVYGLTA